MLTRLNPADQAAVAKEGNAPNPRLLGAAHQFEAMMMKELLAPLSRTSLEDSDGGETGVLGDFASESLAGALSAGGGLGIADRIVNTLSHSGTSRVRGSFPNK
jgi:Rod binding domain-containing protein